MSGVDVVIPCYKYGHFLKQCVESVLTQEGVDVRALIIDDCSPDNTEEVGTQLAAGDKRVEYRRHAVNKGHIATYNEGLIGWATSEYSLLLSADDLFLPGAFKRACGLMDRHPGMGLCYGRDILLRPEEEGRTPETISKIESSAIGILPAGIVRKQGAGKAESVVMGGAEFLEMGWKFCDNPVPASTAVVRTKMQQEIGGYNAKLPHSGDWEMWMRFAARGPVGFVDAYQSLYRWHGGNMQNTYVGAGGVKDLQQRMAAMLAVLDTDGALIEDVAGIKARTARKLAEEALERAGTAFERGDAGWCEACIAYACEICGEAKGLKSYSNLKWKRRLGRKTVSLLRRFYLRKQARSMAAVL